MTGVQVVLVVWSVGAVALAAAGIYSWWRMRVLAARGNQHYQRALRDMENDPVTHWVGSTPAVMVFAGLVWPLALLVVLARRSR